MESCLPSLRGEGRPCHCAVRKTVLLSLLLATLLAALPVASAAATVTSATCAVDDAGACGNGSTVTFTGTDLGDVTSVRIAPASADEVHITCTNVTATATTATCTLATTSTATDLYPVTLVLSNGAAMEAGSLLIGNTYEQKNLPRWTATSRSSAYRVTAQSSDWPSTGDTWSVSGTFDTASTYSIIFYNNQPGAVAGSPGAPTCTPVKVTATTLSCTITTAVGAMGMYSFLVKDVTNNALLPGSTGLSKLAVNPPLPEVSGASGRCATSSASCVSGASLTIVGTNFNSRSAAYQKFVVGVTSAQRSAIQLTPTAVDASGVTVTLNVAEKVPAGSYPVFVRVQVCAMGMMSPLYYVGNLVLGMDSVGGFNLDFPSGGNDGEKMVTKSVMSGGYIAAIVFACVFAFLFLVAIVGFVVVCVRQRRRHRWNMRETCVANQSLNSGDGDIAMHKLPVSMIPYGDA
ncbi:hypothetical protein NQL31_002398 [Lotmaria passim]